MMDTMTGPGRPPIGERFEVRLEPNVRKALDKEAKALGWKRAELVRWIVAQRYFPDPEPDGAAT